MNKIPWGLQISNLLKQKTIVKIHESGKLALLFYVALIMTSRFLKLLTIVFSVTELMADRANNSPNSASIHDSDRLNSSPDNELC